MSGLKMASFMIGMVCGMGVGVLMVTTCIRLLKEIQDKRLRIAKLELEASLNRKRGNAQVVEQEEK